MAGGGTGIVGNQQLSNQIAKSIGMAQQQGMGGANLGAPVNPYAPMLQAGMDAMHPQQMQMPQARPMPVLGRPMMGAGQMQMPSPVIPSQSVGQGPQTLQNPGLFGRGY